MLATLLSGVTGSRVPETLPRLGFASCIMSARSRITTGTNTDFSRGLVRSDECRNTSKTFSRIGRSHHTSPYFECHSAIDEELFSLFFAGDEGKVAADLQVGPTKQMKNSFLFLQETR